MAVKVAATKTVSGKLPYTGKTFQQLAQKLLGGDGYMSGGATSDVGGSVFVDPVTFAQRGIIASTTVTSGGIPVPTAAEPWFVLAAIPDDNPDSGVLFSVTADIAAAAAAVVVAFKTAGRWQTPVSTDIAGAGLRNSETGLETGWEVRPTIDGSGILTSVDVFKGLLVDVDGNRRRPPADATANNGSLAAALTPIRPHPTRVRTDHVVLRQRESYSPEIVQLIGATGTTTDVNPITLGTVTTPAGRAGYYAKRGGGLADQWWAWSDAITLKAQGGPAGEGFGAVTVLTAGATIRETWVVGQRFADSAVVLLYIEGAVLKMVSINPTTGAVVDAAVTIANTGGQISHMRALLDINETAHITFESVGATQQIYYMSCEIAAASFGTADVSVRIVAGSPTASNDTWPSIGITRRGIVTVAYIQGAGADEFGDLLVATIDQGITTDMKLIAASTDAAIDDSTFVSGEVYGGDGYVPTVLADVRRTAVVVDPYDEVYVLTLGEIAGPNVVYVLLHRDGFKEEHGADLLNIATPIAGAAYDALAAVCGEQGEMIVATKDVSGGNVTELTWWTLNPRPLDDGRMGPPTLLRVGSDTIDGRVETSGFDDLHIAPGPTGGFVVNYVLDLDVLTADLPTLGNEILAPHPRDVHLGRWIVPPDTGTTVDASSPDFGIFNTRPKRMNFPFLVGEGGDWQGHNSLREAARWAQRLAAEIVIRPGTYTLEGPIAFNGRVRGEGQAVLIADSALPGEIIMGGGATAVTASVAGNLVTALVEADPGPGSLIDLNVSGRHTVLRNLGPAVGGGIRILVADNDAGPPVGTVMSLFNGGVSIENLTMILLGGYATVIRALGCYQPTLRGLRIEGLGGVLLEKCISPLIDGMDLTKLTNATGQSGLRLIGGDGALIRNVKMADGFGRILIDNDCQNPHLVTCHTDGADPTQVAYEIAAGRTTLALFTGCSGLVLGNVTTLLNGRSLADNTSSDVTQPSLEIIANPAQEQAIATFRGRWGDTLGVQSMIDSIGELSYVGDHFFDDFYEFNGGQFWDVVLASAGGDDGVYQTANPDFSTFTLGALDAHAVKLALTSPATSGPSSALISRYPAGAWTDKPILRMRAKFGNIAAASLFQIAGLITDAGVGLVTDYVAARALVAAFVHNPAGAGGYTASAELQIVVMDDAAVINSQLTGFTPTEDQYYWLWIGWTAAGELSWGISDDLTNAFIVSGTLVATSGTMATDRYRLGAMVRCVGGAGGPAPSLTVDAVGYRSGVRPS